MLLVTSPTVRDALNQVIRFQQLTHLTGQLALEHSEHYSALCYRAKQLDDHLGMLLAQAEISGTFKFIREIYKMMGLSKPDLRIELPFAYPANPNTLKIYHDYYGNQVQFDAPRAAFWFDEAVLDIKIPSKDEKLLQSMKPNVWLNWNGCRRTKRHRLWCSGCRIIWKSKAV